MHVIIYSILLYKHAHMLTTLLGTPEHLLIYV